MAVVVTAKQGFDLGYVWKNQGAGAEATAGGYYINAAQGGEPPGLWWGPGVEALGLAPGQVVEREPYEAVYQQIDPVTGAKLGRKPYNYANSYADHLAGLMAAEPHATYDRVVELEHQAEKMTRQAAPYTDMTVSFSKSISVLHASIRENARQARLAGDDMTAAHWDAVNAEFEAILQDANRAALRYVQQWAGMTRTGYHGAKVNGQETGRYEQADLVVSSWLQGTSRDGDPQDHIHNQIARMVRTQSDGKWRALDTVCLRNALPAAQPIAATHAECALTRRFGVEWIARPDGAGNEIDGITQAQMDAYSSRTVEIKKGIPEAVAAWTQNYGRVPNERELLAIQQAVTMATRKGKREGEVNWDDLTRQWDAKWDAKLGGELAGVATSVSNLGGPAGAAARPSDPGPGMPPTRAAQVRAVQTALAVVQAKQSTWTRAEFMKQLGVALPVETRHMEPAAAEALLTSLTDEAVAGAVEQVARLEAPAWPPVPAYLKRELDGRSVYTRPATSRYATRVQLGMEERLLAQAQREGAAHLTPDAAAAQLGASAALLEAQLHSRAQAARAQSSLAISGLRLDQGAALFHALTSRRTAEVIVGPAGSGKTRTLAAAAKAWRAAGMGDVLGLATAQAARNVLVAAGVDLSENTAQFLGHVEGERGALGIRRELAPNSLIVIDEASMMSMADMESIVSWAAEHGHKVLITGDQEQLTAVEGGGGMMLLARRMGHVQLAEAVRFKAVWEQEASLRLRAGDASVLEDYDEHARLLGDVPEQAMEEARKSYVASYLAGKDVLLMAQERDRCRELSRRIRGDLQHLGLVERGREIRISQGQMASVGDRIIVRKNDHDKGLANGDLLKIESIHDDGKITVRYAVDCDRETGEQRWSDELVTTSRYSKCDLGYAVTGHSAQGRTVTSGLALVTGNENRQWLYVAMTRGTDSNHVIAFTRSAKLSDSLPGTRPAPELARHKRAERERDGQEAEPVRRPGQPEPRAVIAVLSDVLERDGSEASALETQRTNLANVDHLAVLNAQWQGEMGPLRDAHYRRIVRAALPGEFAGAQWSHQATWLARTLRAAEAAGVDPEAAVRRAVEAGSLAGSRDVMAVLDSRIRRDVERLVPQPMGTWASQVPPIEDAERHEYVTDLAAAMDARKERIGEHAAAHSPAWAVHALGPVPDEPLDRLEWTRRAADVGAYRELYSYDHPAEPIGPEPAGDSPEKRAAWHAAAGAMTRVDDLDLHALPDGSLWHMRDTYAAETAWAPQHVGRELRLVRQGAEEAELAAIRADAEAVAAREQGLADREARHLETARSSRWLVSAYRASEAVFAKTMEDRHEWELSTEGSRHLAVAAASELQRRHPGEDIPALRSAEPQPATEEQRAELTRLPDDFAAEAEPPEWVTRLAAQREAFRVKADERKAVRVPSEDPEAQDEGEAWPTWFRLDRDAILQPAQPSIQPAPEVAELARQKGSDDHEAG